MEPSNYKLVHLDEDDAALLREVYAVMYPEREIEMANPAKTIQKFGALKIWSTTFGSKMQPRGIWSSKILASWLADDGQVIQDTSFVVCWGSTLLLQAFNSVGG